MAAKIFDNSKKNESITNIVYDPEAKTFSVKLFTTAEVAKAIAKRLEDEALPISILCANVSSDHIINEGKKGTADQTLTFKGVDKHDVNALIQELAHEENGRSVLSSLGKTLASIALLGEVKAAEPIISI